MFQLRVLAIALQGIGYGTMLTALQGLVAVTIFDMPPGGGARIPVKRRVRRWMSGSWLAVDEDMRQAEAADEDELFVLGLL